MLIIITRPFLDTQREGVLVKAGTLLNYEDNTRAKELIDKKFAKEIEIEEIKLPVKQDSKEDNQTVNYEEMKVAELKKLLEDKGIDYNSKDNRADLIKLLEG